MLSYCKTSLVRELLLCDDRPQRGDLKNVITPITPAFFTTTSNYFFRPDSRRHITEYMLQSFGLDGGLCVLSLTSFITAIPISSQ